MLVPLNGSRLTEQALVVTREVLGADLLQVHLPHVLAPLIAVVGSALGPRRSIA